MGNVIMVIATAVMAIFSSLSWYLAWQLKKEGVARDIEIRELIIKLSASVVASGKAATDPKMASRLFLEHETTLRAAIAESKYPLPKPRE
uniref:Holin n=1 Tax=viral metagenome TaxID=1070528 RepID=A0A6M3XWN8_9ZZZZ